MLKTCFRMTRHKNEVWKGNDAVIKKDKQLTQSRLRIFLLGKNSTNKGWILSRREGARVLLFQSVEFKVQCVTLCPS